MSGHTHAASMLEYGQDAHETKWPYEGWEVSDDGKDWMECLKHPDWVENMFYRRKPSKEL